MSSISNKMDVLATNHQSQTASVSPAAQSSSAQLADTLEHHGVTEPATAYRAAANSALQTPAEGSTSNPNAAKVPAAPTAASGFEKPLTDKQAMWKAIDDDDDVALNKSLVRMGFDVASKQVDTPNNAGETPLIRAAKVGGVKTTCTLLRYGANALIDQVEKTTGYSEKKQVASPVYYAAKHDHPEVIDVLVTVGGASFYDAVHALNAGPVLPSVVRALQSLGAKADDFGATITCAAERDDAVGIVTLVDLGNAQITGVHLIAAVEKNALNSARALLDRGVKVDSVLREEHKGNVYSQKAKRYTTERTALDIASYHGRLEMVQLLMDRKAKVPAQFLDRAIDDGHVRLALEFLDRGVGISKSTLAKAANKGQLSVLAKLIRTGLVKDVQALEGAAVTAEGQMFPKAASLLHTAAALHKLESATTEPAAESSTAGSLRERFKKLKFSGKRNATAQEQASDPKARDAKIQVSRESTKLEVVRGRLELQLDDAETHQTDRPNAQLRVGVRPGANLSAVIPYRSR